MLTWPDLAVSPGPLMFAIDSAGQLYVVAGGTLPLVTSVGITLNGTPLQVTVAIGVILAAGLMVTVTEKTGPVQLPDNGVII